MSQRHKHADIIHAWVEGAEVQFKDLSGKWIDLIDSPRFFEDTEYRIKPKGPKWWENIPEHGILIKLVNYEKEVFLCFETDLDYFDFTKGIPLTNEEIERLKR